MRKWATAGLFTSVLLLCGCGQLVRATSDFAFNEPWKDYQRVEIRVQNGNVELRATDVTDVRVSGRKSVGGLTFAEAEENLNKIVVKAAASSEHPDTLRVDVSFPDELRQKSVGTDLVVQIPQPCAAQVHTSNGKVQVEHLAGPTELVTSNGRITARDVKGNLRAEASNGRIEAQEIDGDLNASTSNGEIVAKVIRGGCTLETSNGSVQAEDVAGNIKAETSNGGIRVSAVPPAGGKLDLRSSNGAIHATLPESFAAEYRLAATNGHVSVSLGQATVKSLEASKRRYHAVVNGGGATVIAETSNGSVTVDTR